MRDIDDILKGPRCAGSELVRAGENLEKVAVIPFRMLRHFGVWFTETDPNKAILLLAGVSLRTSASRNWRFGLCGDECAGSFEVITPAVVWAYQLVVDDLSK